MVANKSGLIILIVGCCLIIGLASYRPINDLIAQPTPAMTNFVYLPLILNKYPVQVQNGGFEEPWIPENGHRCLVIKSDGTLEYRQIENIFVPSRWTFWFRHEPGIWDQPEGRGAPLWLDPHRIHSGAWAYEYFVVYRNMDAGLFQQLEVTPGTHLQLKAWGQAWCETQNFIFNLGIDPTGGINPFANTVTWGEALDVYNGYVEVPEVETTVQGDIVTIFLRSKTRWALRNNNAYWDDVQIITLSK